MCARKLVAGGPGRFAAPGHDGLDRVCAATRVGAGEPGGEEWSPASCLRLRGCVSRLRPRIPGNADTDRAERAECGLRALEPRPIRSSYRDAQRSPRRSAACPWTGPRRRCEQAAAGDRSALRAALDCRKVLDGPAPLSRRVVHICTSLDLIPARPRRCGGIYAGAGDRGGRRHQTESSETAALVRYLIGTVKPLRREQTFLR